jgi:hypothetical protein
MDSEAGALDEPYSTKPAQRSSHTGTQHGFSLCRLAGLCGYSAERGLADYKGSSKTPAEVRYSERILTEKNSREAFSLNSSSGSLKQKYSRLSEVSQLCYRPEVRYSEWKNSREAFYLRIGSPGRTPDGVIRRTRYGRGTPR